MKNSSTTPLSAAQIEALQARFALRLSARLDESSKALPHDITERLRVAREQAVRAATAVPVRQSIPVNVPTMAPVFGLAGVGGAGHASLSGWAANLPQRERDSSHGRRMDEGPLPWGWRVASTLPAVALLLGLWGIQTWVRSEQVQAASDVDFALLTDDLPPSAYADPGFEEYLLTDNPAVELPMADSPPADSPENLP